MKPESVQKLRDAFDGPASRRLMIALDVPTAREALALVDRLAPLGVSFKVGLQLFCAAGSGLIRDVAKASGAPVFADVKLHDIPNTVARAVESLAGQGIGFLNVHAQGGSAMMRAAADALAGADCAPKGLIGVTLLTSLSPDDLADFLRVRAENPADYVLHLAKTARDSGLDGVVCSAREAAAIRAACGAHFLLMTPGIRPADASLDDQSRVVTPAHALAAGSDVIIVGRPVTAATDPVSAAKRILDDMQIVRHAK